MMPWIMICFDVMATALLTVWKGQYFNAVKCERHQPDSIRVHRYWLLGLVQSALTCYRIGLHPDLRNISDFPSETFLARHFPAGQDPNIEPFTFHACIIYVDPHVNMFHIRAVDTSFHWSCSPHLSSPLPLTNTALLLAIPMLPCSICTQRVTATIGRIYNRIKASTVPNLGTQSHQFLFLNSIVLTLLSFFKSIAF